MKKNIASTVVLSLILSFSQLAYSQESLVDSLKLTPLTTKSGAATLYKLSFVPREIIPSNARFDIEFPGEFDISLLSLAGSNTMDGGFSVSVDGTKLAINRNGEGKQVGPGVPSNLLFSIVRNPSGSSSNSYQIQFQIVGGDGKALTQLQTVSVRIEN